MTIHHDPELRPHKPTVIEAELCKYIAELEDRLAMSQKYGLSESSKHTIEVLTESIKIIEAERDRLRSKLGKTSALLGDAIKALAQLNGLTG